MNNHVLLFRISITGPVINLLFVKVKKETRNYNVNPTTQMQENFKISQCLTIGS